MSTPTNDGGQMPEGLPPLPPVPEGYDRWEYLGQNGVPNPDAPQCHLMRTRFEGFEWEVFCAGNCRDTHWCEAVRAPELSATLSESQIESCDRPTPGEGITDKERLDWLQREACDLQCFDMATGQGDADIGWRVISHHMAKPYERAIGEAFKDDLRAAIDAAMGNEKGDTP